MDAVATPRRRLHRTQTPSDAERPQLLPGTNRMLHCAEGKGRHIITGYMRRFPIGSWTTSHLTMGPSPVRRCTRRLDCEPTQFIVRFDPHLAFFVSAAYRTCDERGCNGSGRIE